MYAVTMYNITPHTLTHTHRHTNMLTIGGNPKIDCPETIDYTEDDSIITLSCNVIGNPKPNIIGFVSILL